MKVDDREIAIFNLGDRFLAIDNHCPHQGGPLADGIVSGSTVVCPLHAWKIDLAGGGVQRPTDMTACVETFRTRVEGGVIMVEVPLARVNRALTGTDHQQLAGICHG